MKRIVFSAIILCSVHALAAPESSIPSYLDKCFTEAARTYGVEKTLLQAIATTESGLRTDAINHNVSTSSYDIGIMQINSFWVPILQKHGISEFDLFHPCVNIHVGAWILRRNIDRLGPTWMAVGAYNARSKEKQKRYVERVWKQYQRLARQTTMHH